MGVGKRIKSIRTKRRLSQSDLAGDAFSSNYLSQIERELIKPSQRAIAHCARILKVPEYVLTNTESELTRSIDAELNEKYICMRQAFTDHDYKKCIHIYHEIDEYGLHMDTHELLDMTLWAAKSYLILHDSENSMRLVNSIITNNCKYRECELDVLLEFNLCQADIYYVKGAFNKALKCRLEIERKINDFHLEFDINLRIENLSWLQVLYEFLDDKDQVKAYFDKIQVLAKDYQVITSGLLRSMTRYYRYIDSMSLHEKMLEFELLSKMSKMIDDWDRIAIICCYKIELLFEQKDYMAIERQLEELSIIIPKMNTLIFINCSKAYMYLFRSKLMTAYDKYDEAKKYLNVAVEFLEENKETPAITLMIDCYLQSATLFYMKEEDDSAMLYLIMAEEASRKYDLLNRLPKIDNLRSKILESKASRLVSVATS
ncbi:helix-turn-helix transcriptional regulator [Acidaminobacter sp. JC074]|uniref:helix-turn-helix domain-containing protein n=1 Tax=Acidaminobacter sp. JC074 TaxID=2530199 RepID=UPI001F0E9132|nr:helix-turn-helix domain-containing protein [Acidaminobacter sp. JC074]MCH4890954.1 helix-turn-helix transcriptional regulator [Acidaminobacter sp. JC074]